MSFAFSVTAMILAVQLATLVGIITTTVNIARLRHLKPGKVAAVLGLEAAAALLFLAVGISNRLLSGTELIARYSSYQPPMTDWEISLARGAFQQAWGWAAGALLVAALCITLSVARLVANRRLARQPIVETVQQQTSRLEIPV